MSTYRAQQFVKAVKEFDRKELLEAIAQELKQQPALLKQSPELERLIKELDAV